MVSIKGLRFSWYMLSLGILFANSIVLYATFLFAYFINNYVFAISINSINEADFELWFLTACNIFAVLGILQYIMYKK